ncbi:tyrosine-type recombinase/integrase [Paraburkholderia domus]|uniref:tyrosine-type recombinase/integrase n=1 Tax=Paraburkholderia domus TaxID=2793075 RepID=UPI001912AAD5|nr:site-specific integrase [Paraburkholderia domus]MBK5065986.1 tyrosine-type recombinase/integrase [Burkholderia sp. R-70199]CAE6965143.1 Tyrosine recombinase XerC [Paraburkholderia domus]
MNSRNWLTDPAEAYLEWQANEAAGADRRPFSPRSIVQHAAMFDRLLRHLIAHEVTLATFGAEHLESFFAELDRRCHPGTSTRPRYIKLIDRLGRELVETGLRGSNPAAGYVQLQRWPEGEPQPVFLDPDADALLQTHVQPRAGDGVIERRNRAIVALLLGTGITSAEIRSARNEHLVIDSVRPLLYVPRHGPRAERKVTLNPFAVDALVAWEKEMVKAAATALLFPAPRKGGPMSDMFLVLVVRDALERIGFSASDMSPRVLRNTYARRALIAGRTHDELSAMLGLSTHRTVVRLQETIAVRAAGA